MTKELSDAAIEAGRNALKSGMIINGAASISMLTLIAITTTSAHADEYEVTQKTCSEARKFAKHAVWASMGSALHVRPYKAPVSEEELYDEAGDNPYSQKAALTVHDLFT